MAIKKCDCKHSWQDKQYGEGKRVHNPKDDGRWVCTVCEKINS